jgi:hypothetical protein
MGYTGAGINRTRAHLHLEIALMLSSRYADWSYGTINYHGLYNGMNLAGMDCAAFFMAHRAKPDLTIAQFLATYPVYYKVTIPNQAAVEIATRYPWLLKTPPEKSSHSWEISFSDTGMPLAIVASDRIVSQPTVTMVKPSNIAHRYRTRNLLTGEGPRASLGRDGINLVNLLSGNFPTAPNKPR